MLTLSQLGDELRSRLETLDPDAMSCAQAAEAMEVFAEIERVGAAGRVLCAQRAAQSTRWVDEGHRNVASWVAATTQGSIGDALATLETSRSLEVLPSTAEALRHGELSFDQVREIASVAGARPEVEADLLAVADDNNLKSLKEACVRERARASSAAGENERYLKIQRARYLRNWSDPDGAFRLDARLTPDAGAKVLASLQPEADLIFEEARKRGDREPQAAYMADALVACASGEARSGGGSGSSGRPSVHYRIDAAALKRGHVEKGEVCDIPGVGPVPVSRVIRVMSDSAMKYFAIHGKDVLSVCHVGRTVPAHLQSALEERDPVCQAPSCGVAHGLEIHHWKVPYADCKTTSLDGLVRVCTFHHDLITYEAYVLEGGPGKWVLRPPPDADPFDTS